MWQSTCAKGQLVPRRWPSLSHEGPRHWGSQVSARLPVLPLPLTLLFHCPPPQNQVRREITYALRSLPWISVPTVALFFAEVRGYSKLYDNIEDSPYGELLPHTPSTGRHPLPDTHVTSLAPPFLLMMAHLV